MRLSPDRTWIVAVAISVVATTELQAQVVETPTPGTPLPLPERRHVAEWVRQFASADAMLRGVDLVVVATAGTPEAGRTVARTGGAPPLQFETVPLVVSEVLRANPPVGAKVGDSIRLERLAGFRSLKGTRHDADHDLGPLTPGKKYVLFLDRQPTAPFGFIQVTHEARYEVSEDGRLASAADGVVARSLRGQTVATLKTMVGQ